MDVRGCRGHDHMVVGFTTTYVISAYLHYRCEFESHSGEVHTIHHSVIKFFSEMRQVSDFLRILSLRFPPLIKFDNHDINEILLTVALNTITS